MSATLQAMEAVYVSLHNNNDQIDSHIAALKKAMVSEGVTSVEADPARLPQANRQGRKMMQSYFKQRGVVVTFPKTAP
jgi:hypothetical protein